MAALFWTLQMFPTQGASLPANRLPWPFVHRIAPLNSVDNDPGSRFMRRFPAEAAYQWTSGNGKLLAMQNSATLHTRHPHSGTFPGTEAIRNFLIHLMENVQTRNCLELV